MALKGDLQQLNSDLNQIGDNLDEDLRRLEAKVAEGAAAEDVSDEISALRSTVDRLRGLDRPNPNDAPAETVPAGTGTVVNPDILSGGGTVAVDSPGENQPVEDVPAPGTVEEPAPHEVATADEDEAESPNGRNIQNDHPWSEDEIDYQLSRARDKEVAQNRIDFPPENEPEIDEKPKGFKLRPEDFKRIKEANEAELKEELRQRELSTGGSPAELRTRLAQAVQAGYEDDGDSGSN